MTKKPTVHVRNDKPSKPQTHRTDAAKGPMTYVAVPHPDKTSGYKGKLVPATPAAKKAQKFLAKQSVPVNPATYIGG
jgi:hypothetical protein